jgi:hypothetical protein
VAVSGGFRTTVGGLRISARSPLPILLLALINFTTWLSWARRAQSVDADLESTWRAIERHSSRLIGVAALAATLVAAIFATESAAGADASGYLSEARAWLRPLPPLHVELLTQDFPELDGWITTPLGWRPAPDSCDSCVGVQVPTYPPGLPLLMAIPQVLGGIDGANAIVIASAAAVVWATGMLSGGVAGVIAATLIAFTPIFTNQSIQPMSDVPVTAAWMLCFLFMQRQRTVAAGIACAVAVLIRPNLAPLAIVPLLIAHRRITFATPVAIAGMFLAVINWVWYGSPFRSGYGSTDALFAFTNIAANAPRYFSWLMSTSPILLLSVFSFWRLRRQRTVQSLLAFVALVVCSYLVYAVFDDWSYLRFLLPALAVLAVFAAIELAAWIGRRPIAYRAPLLLALVLLLTAHGLWVARSRATFKLANQLRRVAVVADYVNADVPPAAVILAGEQSGSMRYYTDRPILRWEAATPEALAAAMTTLEQSRRPVYIVLDAWEQGPFRTKFAALPAAALDWPPLLDAGTSHRTQLWKLSDRERFVRGENLSTIRLP